MRYILFILLILSLDCIAQQTCNQAQPITDNRAYVITVSGQSLAVGQCGANNTGYAQLPDEYKYSNDSLLIWYEGNYLTIDTSMGAFTTAAWNTNTVNYAYTNPGGASYDFGGYSVELLSSRLLNTLTQKKVYILKSAYGATAITAWVSPAGTRWIELERYIRRGTAAIIATGKVPYFVSFMWLQGQQDVLNHEAYLYEGRMRTFITNLRAINQYTDSMQICMYLLDETGSGSYLVDSVKKVNTAMKNIAADTYNCITIATTGDPMWSYPHNSAAGYIILGQKGYQQSIYPQVQTYIMKIVR